ncbi:MAG: sodium:solute symporter family protein [Pontiellaceae bacterium]|nr:sodium:solute symporter family protein [Pontiellaceae bacterium]MBN2783339.1 sodium:solute symporter family protein [Pontiellaceae bacterium]
MNVVALWGFSLKEVLVARYVAPRMVRFPKAISIGDIVEHAYGKPSRLIVGILSIMLCAGIVGAQVGGIGYIFNVFLGVPVTWGILIGCSIVVLYATVGGMNAVIKTDIIQFIVLSVGLPLTLILGYLYLRKNGISTPVADHFTWAHSEMTAAGFISLFLTFVLGETMVPPYVQRLLISRDNRHVIRGTLYSGLFSIPFFAITGLIGAVAYALNPDLEANLALPFVVKEVLPIGIKGIVISGVISIVMSSADSFLNSASIAFTNDVLGVMVDLREKTRLQVARAVTFLTGLLAIVFAISIKSVLDVLIMAYNFWSPLVLVQIVAAIWGVRTSMGVFLAGSMAGLAGMLLWNAFMKEASGVDGLVIGVAANLLTFMLMLKWCGMPSGEESAAR